MKILCKHVARSLSLCCLYARFHRLFRLRPTACHDSAGHHRRPRAAMYSVTKGYRSCWSDYYFNKCGQCALGCVSGIISVVTPPGRQQHILCPVGIYYSAVKAVCFVCPISEGTMDMMYMPDALHAAISLMEADPSNWCTANSFNGVASAGSET